MSLKVKLASPRGWTTRGSERLISVASFSIFFSIFQSDDVAGHMP